MWRMLPCLWVEMVPMIELVLLVWSIVLYPCFMCALNGVTSTKICAIYRADESISHPKELFFVGGGGFLLVLQAIFPE